MNRSIGHILIIICGPLCLFLLSANPPASQQVTTIEEAAQVNGALALQLCITPGIQGPQRAEMFRHAGFAETVERSTENSDTTHSFTAPSESARVELYYGEMPEHCIVTSDHMGVGAASGVLDQVVPGLYPGFVRRVDAGPVDPATGQPAQCVSYEDPTNPIGYMVGVSAGGGAQGCVDNGTSVMFMSARV